MRELTLKGKMQSNLCQRAPLSDNKRGSSVAETGHSFWSRRTKNPYIDSCLKPLYERPHLYNGYFSSVPKVAIVEKFNIKHFRIYMNSFLVPWCFSGFSMVVAAQASCEKKQRHHSGKERLGTN